MVKPDISDGVPNNELNATSAPSGKTICEVYYTSLISHFNQPIGLINENYYNTHNASLLYVWDKILSGDS